MSRLDERNRRVSEGLKARYREDPAYREKARAAGAKGAATRAKKAADRESKIDVLLDEVRALKSEVEDLRNYLLWDSTGGDR
ncbi:hypothetical protein [Kocuria sp. CPCC 205261]|uniref:hypothetical protein n=1 Tax=Kocuria sp. CPCC 205261 TaxID=3073554 RepID=UPI0034D64AB2